MDHTFLPQFTIDDHHRVEFNEETHSVATEALQAIEASKSENILPKLMENPSFESLCEFFPDVMKMLRTEREKQQLIEALVMVDNRMFLLKYLKNMQDRFSYRTNQSAALVHSFHELDVFPDWSGMFGRDSDDDDDDSITNNAILRKLPPVILEQKKKIDQGYNRPHQLSNASLMNRPISSAPQQTSSILQKETSIQEAQNNSNKYLKPVAHQIPKTTITTTTTTITPNFRTQLIAHKRQELTHNTNIHNNHVVGVSAPRLITLGAPKKDQQPIENAVIPPIPSTPIVSSSPNSVKRHQVIAFCVFF